MRRLPRMEMLSVPPRLRVVSQESCVQEEKEASALTWHFASEAAPRMRITASSFLWHLPQSYRS